VERFVHDEKYLLSPLNSPIQYIGRDQKMLLYVRVLSDCRSEVVFSDDESQWLYLIFPAFLAAVSRGIRIRYVTKNSANVVCSHEIYRRRLLTGLGVEIIDSNPLPFRGFMSDLYLDIGVMALAELPSNGDKFGYEITKTYTLQTDPTVFKKVRDGLEAVLRDHPRHAAVVVSYEECPQDRLFGLLRTINHYSKAKLEVMEVTIDENLFALQSHIKEFKYLQIDWLISDFLEKGIELFQPQEVVLQCGSRTIITPPVVEISGNRKVLIEGHTRAFHCMRAGMKSFLAITAESVVAPLPTTTQKFLDLSVASRTVDFHAQFGNLDRSLWRDIESHMHPTGA
jgi:hypothetical protein